MIAYISGPMRGLPEHNYPMFFEAEQALIASGYGVLNPARNFDGDKTREVAEYMREDIHSVLNADALVLLPGWETSEGAKVEVAVARSLDLNFYKAEFTELGWTFEPFEPGDGPVIHDNSPRVSALNEAKALITGDRNNAYGPPTQDFKRTANMASGFGFRVVPHEGAEPVELSPHHVAIFLILLKMSRLAWTPGKRDSWVDTAGYAGCGYECAVEAS